MAHGFLESFDHRLIVRSAGTEPASEVNPKAVEAMKAINIDISKHKPYLVDEYLNEEWDYVITVCDDANEKCPAFLGKVENRLHIGFEDPSKAIGTNEFIWSEFIRVRDEIKTEFYKLFKEKIESKL
jgi:arsenate reductase